MVIQLVKIREDALARINRTVFSIQPEEKFNEFEFNAVDFCNDFLILAATSLLVDMKPSLFFLNLCRCAENWRRFSAISNKCYNRRPTLMYCAPFHAAIIANDPSLINRLISEMPKQWCKGEEYEDQFYMTWLHMLLSANNVNTNANVMTHLTALARCDKDGGPTVLFKSLLGLDDLTEMDFWAQFETRLYAHIEIIEKKAQSSFTPFTRFAAHRYLWFEGITWLRLATLNNFTPPSNTYQFCPEEALAPMPEPYLGDWIMLPDVML